MKIGKQMLTAIALLIFPLAAVTLSAAPQAELWPRWEAHDPSSVEIVDHSPWTEILGDYLVPGLPDGLTGFDYSALSSTDRKRLDGYIDYLAGLEISGYKRDEQFAYWVNLYNALTVQLILDIYPLAGIRDINKPWDSPLVEVESEQLTLNDIEHRILRPIWQDPRIHYAVNCASIGCPNLAPQAYTGANYPELLDRAAREYINSPRGADFSGRNPRFSSIFDWYAVDFGGSAEGVVEHMLLYAEGARRSALLEMQESRRWRSLDYRYDWGLNDADG